MTTKPNGNKIKAYQAILQNYKYMNYMMVNQLEFISSHDGLTGNYRERMWLSYFRSIIPQKYSLAQGVIIIDSKGKQSREVDIAVFDEQYTPYVFQYDSIKYIPIEAVAVVISCKSKKVSESNLKKWSESINRLRPSRAGITRTITDLNIGYQNKTQTRTRPIKILATLKEYIDKINNRYCIDFCEKYKDHYDFIILEHKLDQKKLADNSEEILRKFDVRLNYPEWTLGEWYRKLNHGDKDFDISKLPIDLDKEIKEDGVLRLAPKKDGDHPIKNHGNTESSIASRLENTLGDLRIDGFPLLTLNLQLNQLLMLINNPMLFPHYAYAAEFKKQVNNMNGDKNKKSEKDGAEV
jgi:hypothetical protein